MGHKLGGGGGKVSRPMSMYKLRGTVAHRTAINHFDKDHSIASLPSPGVPTPQNPHSAHTHTHTLYPRQKAKGVSESGLKGSRHIRLTTHTHTHTRTRTQTRMHARTHTRTHARACTHHKHTPLFPEGE